MVSELKPEDFDERYAPIVEEVVKNASYWKFDANYFFPHWRKLMKLGLARTWEAPGAILGALIVENLYSGAKTALVVFWFSKEEGRQGKHTLKLMETAIREVKKAGAVSIASSAYFKLNGKKMNRLYKILGFEELETVHQKFL